MISVTDPIQRSMDWTKKILFNPFQFGKWCAMGFTVFLANLLGGGSMSYRSGNPWKGSGGHTPFDGGMDTVRVWILAHLALVAILAVVALGIAVILVWLGSRGQFMFLDNVVNNRGEVSGPWNRFREHGNRLFTFTLLLDLAGLLLVGAGLYAGWRIAAQDILEAHFGMAAVKGILVAACIIVPPGLVLAVVGLLARDFVVPVMYVRGTTVAEGFRILWNEVMPGHGGSFVLFYLMKIVLSLAAFIVIFFGTCLTCCVAGLPYVSSVVFLPVFVFFRGFSLAFMGQAGEQWNLLRESSPH